MPEPKISQVVNGTPDMAQMMENLAGNDPRLAMVMQMMEAQRGRGDPDVDDAAGEEGEDALTGLVDELQERLAAAEIRFERLRRKTRALVNAHREVLDQLADLAGALGACGLCWGRDAHCPSCRGRGRPGMVRPDKALRAELFGRPRIRSETTEGQFLPDISNSGNMETEDAR